MKKLKCRFCSNEFETLFDLRLHVLNMHHAAYVTFIQPYLYDTDSKLQFVEATANECMIGCYEDKFDGSRH